MKLNEQEIKKFSKDNKLDVVEGKPYSLILYKDKHYIVHKSEMEKFLQKILKGSDVNEGI